MLRLMVMAGLAIVLSACASLHTPEQRMLAACGSATSAINSLAVIQHRLNGTQVEAVNYAVSAIQPICGAGVLPPTDKLVLLEGLTSGLLDMVGEMK